MKRTNASKKKQASFLDVGAVSLVLNFLMRYPYDSFTISEIATKAEVSKSTASRIVKELVKEQIVVVGHLANLHRVKFNAQSLKALGLKIGTNIITVYSSGIVDFIINTWGAPRAIILFGSFRKGEDGPDSDVDIAIETSEEHDLQVVPLSTINTPEAQKIREWEQTTGRQIKLHFFSKAKVDRNVFTNIANGIALYGFLDVKP